MEFAQQPHPDAEVMPPSPPLEGTPVRWRAIKDELDPAYQAASADTLASSDRIEHLPAAMLELHAVASDVPPVKQEQMAEMVAEAKDAGNIGPRPLVVLPDRKTVIFGFHELAAAREAKLTFVPCIVVDEADPKAFALRQTLLIPQLSDDQRAVVAMRLKDHLSMVLKSVRGKAAAAAKKEVDLSAQRTDKSEKRDARKETAKEMQVSERKLRALSAIAAYEEKHPPKDGTPAIERIALGKSSIATELKLVTEAEEKEKLAAKQEEVASLPVLDDWLNGDTISLIKDRLGDRKVGLLLIDEAEMGEDSLKRLIDVVSPSLDADASIINVTSFDNEVMLRRTLQTASFTVSRPMVVDTSQATAGASLGQRHLSVLRSTRGRAVSPKHSLTRDVLDQPGVNGRAHVLKQIIETFSEPNSLIVCPFAADESGYVAARRSGRSVLAVAASEDVFVTGRARIDEASAPSSSAASVEGGAK